MTAVATTTTFTAPNAVHDPSERISIFQVYSYGLCCSECRKPVGTGIDTVSRHIKKNHHDLLRTIPCMKSLHNCLVKTVAKLRAVPRVPEGNIVTRYKCLICGSSFALGDGPSKFFFRHIK
jgi:transposase-like protein